MYLLLCLLVGLPNPLRLHPTSMSYVFKLFKNLDMLWMGIWVHPYTVTPEQQIGAGCWCWVFGGRLEPEWWCNAKMEAQTPHGVSSTSIWQACKVFEHLDMLLMSIWVHTHTEVPYLSLGPILRNDFGVGTNLSNVVTSWLSLKPPQSASQIHSIYI